MPRTYNATQESVIRGGYVPFLLKRDIDQASLKGAVQELNTSNRAAIQQKNVIMEALAKADLNPADSEWRDAYAQQIESELQKEVIGGSYAKALPTAMELAGKVASNPELLARQKANKEYQAHKNVVDNMVASGKLPQRIADQWMEENPYKFDAIKDRNGRVIGAKEWRPNWNVVAPIDMSQVYSEVGRLAAEEAGGGQNVRFVDENGNTVANPSNGMYSMEIKTGSQWHRLPASKLKAMFDAVLDQIPGARETFEQDYKNKLWQFGKADDEGKKAFYGSDIIDDQGVKRTLDEYIAYKSDPIFNGMAYNRVSSTVDYSPNTAYLTGKMQQAADMAAAQAIIDAGQQSGAGIEIPLNNMLTETVMSITNDTKGLLDLFSKNGTYQGDLNWANNLVNKGDYIELANFLDRRLSNIKSPEDRIKAQNYIRLLRSEGTTYNSFVDGMSKDDLDVLDAYISMKTGVSIPKANNNKIAKELAIKRNILFSSLKGKYPDNSFYIALANDDVYDRFLSSLSLNQNELEAHGIKLSKQNGKTVLDITKNTDILPEIAEFVRQEESRGTTRNWSLKSGLGNFGDKNVVVGRHTLTSSPTTTMGVMSGIASTIGGETGSWIGNISSIAANPLNITKMFNEGYDITRDDVTAKNILMDFSPQSDYYTNLENRANRILKNNGKVMTSTPTITAWGSGSSYALQDVAKQGYMKITDLKTSDDLITGQERGLIKTGLGHIGDFKVWKLNPDTKNFELVTPDEEEKIQEYLNSAVADDKFEVKFTVSDTDKGYGHAISIPAGTDKEGAPQGIREAQQYYIEGLADSETSERLARQPDLIYNREYHRARALNTPIKDVTGKPIIYDAGNEEVERNKFLAVKAMDDIYKQIETVAYNSANIRSKTGKNNLIPEEQYELWAKNLLVASGYDPNTTEGIKQKTKLMDKFRNQFFRIYNAK